MRPGQNKRMRGRNNNNNNNRKGPNPLTRSYESNGPDVKIRGTAHHIGEKYLQLARDAQSSGDPVMAESYLQHAEHYFRLIAAAQQAQQQAAYGYQRPPGEPEQDEDGDDDFESLPDRFASPGERAAQNPPPVAPQPYPERQPFNGNNNNGQPYEARQNYQNQPQPTYDRQPQPDRSPQPDRQQQNFDRNQDHGQERSQERSYDNRNGRGDRGGFQDRGNGQGYQGPQSQNHQGQNHQGQNHQQGNGHAPERQQDRQQRDQTRDQDRPPRDYDNRNFRNNRGPRDPRDFREGSQPAQPREQRQPQIEEPVGGGLPAFITGPTRAVVETASDHGPESAAPMTQAAGDATEDTNIMRPRRRRRPKSEFPAGGDEGEARQEAGEPAGD